MNTGKRSLKLLIAVLTAVVVLAQTICVYAEEISGTVRVNDFLNVRESADDDAAIVKVLHNGDKVVIVGTEGEWFKVSGEHNGYVHSGYVAIDVNAQEAETSEQAQAEQSAAAADNSSQKTTEGTTESGVTPEEIRLMAALIACECGAGDYNGKLAVGAVIMNRARIYGGIKEAIYAPAQFGPVSSGKLAATLAVNAIDPVSMQAATDAANGANNIGLATHFRNVRSGYTGIVAGNHVFW